MDSLTTGMTNSPTLCQEFIARSLQSLRQEYPSYILYHYMDDLLLAAPSIAECNEFFFKSTRLFPCPGYYKQCCDEHWGT